MGIYKLTAKKADGQVQLLCPDCGGPTEMQYGARDKDQLTYVLSCVTCQNILGEWATKEEMGKELDAFRAKALAE